MVIFVSLLAILYFNGRDFHISEEVGDREVEVFN